MNNLPQELVDQISSYLSRGDLKNTLLLSPEFQNAAEQYSGAFSGFVLTEDNASKFLKTYSGRHFRHLRTVEFRPRLSALDWDKEAHKSDDHSINYPVCRDTVDDLKQMDQEFTRQIFFLFETIKTVEVRTANVYNTTKVHLTIYTPTREIDRNCFCLHRVFVGWYIHLLSPKELPCLRSVRYLDVENGSRIWGYCEPVPALRKLDLRVILDLSNKLPNLESLGCKIGGDDWQPGSDNEVAKHFTHTWEGPRRDSRHDFGKALDFAALRNLRCVTLDFLNPVEYTGYIDQRQAMPNLTVPAKHDPFSSSLHLLSHQLRRMRLRLVADETLFWPTNGSVPAWPNLEKLSVMFHMTSPNGSWYFRGLQNEGATEGYTIDEQSYPPVTNEGKVRAEDRKWDLRENYLDWNDHSSTQYRVVPNEDTLVPFLTSFARAATSMPSLTQAALWSPIDISPVDVGESDEEFELENSNDHQYLAWGLAYIKPGTDAFLDHPGEEISREISKEISKVRQIWWKVAKWRPDPELHKLVQAIGYQEHGEGLQEHWVDSRYGQDLIRREPFRGFENRLSSAYY
jgi:hypothetical protein